MWLGYINNPNLSASDAYGCCDWVFPWAPVAFLFDAYGSWVSIPMLGFYACISIDALLSLCSLPFCCWFLLLMYAYIHIYWHICVGGESNPPLITCLCFVDAHIYAYVLILASFDALWLLWSLPLCCWFILLMYPYIDTCMGTYVMVISLIRLRSHVCTSMLNQWRN